MEVTQEDIEYLYHALFDLLEEDEKQALTNRWNRISDASGEDIKLPFIRTELIEEDVFGETQGVCIQINLRESKKRNESIVDTIYHEIGHCLHASTGEILFSESSSEAEIYAKRFAEKCLKRIPNKKINHLIHDERICRIASDYNLSPLV